MGKGCHPLGSDNVWVHDWDCKGDCLPPLFAPSSAPTSPREVVLDTAKQLVMGDRNNQYGPPTQDFDRTAAVLNGLGYRKGADGQPLASHDVAVILAAVKLSRLMWSPQKEDSWVDLAGYAACGYECAVEESK